MYQAAAAQGWKHAGMPWPVIRMLGLVVPMLREVARMYTRAQRVVADGTPAELTGALAGRSLIVQAAIYGRAIDERVATTFFEGLQLP